jgi:hypothetical protein
VTQEPKANQASLVVPADQVHPVILDSLVKFLQKLAKFQLNHHVKNARQVRLVHQVHREAQETLVLQVHQATQEKMVNQAFQVHKDHQVPMANQAKMGRLGTQEHQQFHHRRSQATKDQMVILVPRVHQAHQDQRAKMDNQVDPVPKVLQVHQDQQVKMVKPGQKDPKGQKDHLERKVSVQNIALWTAASFSKMEQGVKRYAFKNIHYLLCFIIFSHF